MAQDAEVLSERQGREGGRENESMVVLLVVIDTVSAHKYTREASTLFVMGLMMWLVSVRPHTDRERGGGARRKKGWDHE